MSTSYPEVVISKRRYVHRYHHDNWTCEAGVDIDYSGVAPRIILCRKPAKLYGMMITKGYSAEPRNQ